MKKIILCLSLIFLAIFNANAFATLGVSGCSEWNKSRVATNYGKNKDITLEQALTDISLQFFIVGYVNAVATHLSLTQNADILKGKTKEQLMELVDDECQKNPSKDVAMSAFLASFRLVTIK